MSFQALLGLLEHLSVCMKSFHKQPRGGWISFMVTEASQHECPKRSHQKLHGLFYPSPGNYTSHSCCSLFV